MFDWDISWEELIPNKEYEFQEGMELECSSVTSALGVFARPSVEVERHLDQVGDMSVLGLEVVAAAATMEWIIPKGKAFYCLTGG